MPFGRSYAGLDSLSAYRASVAQRMPTPSPAQYVGSMIFCRCSTCSAVVASSPRNMVNYSQSSGATTSFPIVAAIRPAARIVSALQHEPHRHNGPSRAATVLPWPSGFSPSYMKFSTGSWRDVIVARRSRKSSASLTRRPWSHFGSLCGFAANESPLGQSRQVAGGSKGLLRTFHSFLLEIWSFTKSKPTAKSLLAHLSQPKAIERMVAASGGHDLRAFDNLTTLKTWADQGPPKGTLYHYPNPYDQPDPIDCRAANTAQDRSADLFLGPHDPDDSPPHAGRAAREDARLG